MKRWVDGLALAALAMASAVLAQAPDGTMEPAPMTREQMLEQRRADLRSALRGQRSADDNANQPAAGWNLSPEDRAELRQQLRQDKSKPKAERP